MTSDSKPLTAKQLAALKRKEKFLKNSDNRLDRITGVHKGKSVVEINEEAKTKEVEVLLEDVVEAQKRKDEAEKAKQNKPAATKPIKEDILKKTQDLQQQLQVEQLEKVKKYGYSLLALLFSVLIAFLLTTAEITPARMSTDELFSKLQFESILWEEIVATFPFLGVIPDFFSVFFLFELVYQGVSFLSGNSTNDQVVVAFLTHFATGLINHICFLVFLFGTVSMVY